MFKNFLSNTINKVRPPEPDPYSFEEKGRDLPVRITPNRSPRWQNNTKQLVIIALLVIVVISMFFLRNMIGPIVFALILTYLVQPIISYIQKKTRISWKTSAAIVYILLLILVIGIIAWGGFAIFSQAENLINFLISLTDNSPDYINNLLNSDTLSEPLKNNLKMLFDSDFGLQISGSLQDILKNLAGGLASFAQSAVSKIGWLFFVIGFSFFLVYKSKDIEKSETFFSVEGYEFDILMAKQQVSRIWNSFLRGQIILMIFTIFLYTIVFSIFGLRYSFVLALVVGIARLIPYVGSTVAFAAYGIVAYFQESTFLGMSPLVYALFVVGVAFVIDKIMDGVVTPKVMADTLKIHPALVLLSAIICSRLLGFVGIFLAAPIIASLKLILNYILRKLRDQDPWEGFETINRPVPIKEILNTTYEKIIKSLSEIYLYINRKWKNFIEKTRKKSVKKERSVERK